MRSRLLLAGAFLVTAAGCVKQDTDILARVGKRALDQGRDATAGLRTRLATYLPNSTPAAPGTDSLEDRVSQRLRTDKALQGVRFDVVASGGEIELKGTATEEQKRRATELAEATVGVEKVTDSTVVTALP
jgi:osmotically-inducible protein OsmY